MPEDREQKAITVQYKILPRANAPAGRPLPVPALTSVITPALAFGLGINAMRHFTRNVQTAQAGLAGGKLIEKVIGNVVDHVLRLGK